MITFRREKLDDCYQDVENMMGVITEEMENSLPFSPNVDWKYYFDMEDLDLLCMVVAREGDELIGYAGFLLTADPNTSTTQACLTSMFIHPSHRKFGTAQKLIQASEKELKKQGVQLVTFLVNPEKDYSVLLRKEGYKPSTVMYIKGL